MTIRELLVSAAGMLHHAEVPDPVTDAEWLLAAVLHLGRMELRMNASSEISSNDRESFLQLINKRCDRVPLQYLLGTQSFYGFDFFVDHRVLIPRPETENLCEKAMEILMKRSSPRVLDLCTGSGAIAVTIKKQMPSAEVYACDLSHDALTVACRNAGHHHAPIHFFEGDLFTALPDDIGAFDAVLSNPPYISKADCAGLQPEVTYEPMLALEAGPDGLDFYRRIVAEAPFYLKEEGFLMMELGDGEGRAVSEMLKEHGYQRIVIDPDLEGMDRIISAFGPRHL